MRPVWDIFCSVIDNFGDIGVSWRLARQLAAEHDLYVRLWSDDLNAFCRLNPEASAERDRQMIDGVELHRWPHQWQPVPPADVVIETFACQLPAAYINAMAQRTSPTLWLNLEYLSAENWIAGCHGLPSLQPGGLHKFFFFPGFSAHTGGLLRERGLLEQRRHFQQGTGTRQQFLQRIGVSAQADARLISLFAYDNPSLGSWLDALATARQPAHLLVPEGRIIGELQHWLRLDRLLAGEVHRRGALTVQIINFLSQPDYDRLLWCCDFNVVRGEDSFVRAQWAGRPMLWHIYPQQENAHVHKLDAFLCLYSQGLSAVTRNALLSLWRDWNSGKSMRRSWPALDAVLPELNEHAENWCQQLAAQTNLTTALVQFHRNWLKCAASKTINPSLSGH